MLVSFILEEQSRFLNTGKITSSAEAISPRQENFPDVNSHLLREERMGERTGAATLVCDMGMGILLTERGPKGLAGVSHWSSVPTVQ